MAGMTTLLKRLRGDAVRAQQWDQRKEDLPWFDHPDAIEVLNKRRAEHRYNDEQYELLKHWIDYGYVVVDGYVPEPWIDGMLNDLDDVWKTNKAIRGLTIEQLRLQPSDPQGLPHSKLVEVDEATRMKLRREQRWRIHGFHAHSAATRKIFQMPKLTELCSLVFDRPASPEYTINFMFGSEQHLHQDTCVFQIHPMNHLIGLWLACEDVQPGCGPLVFYPGSHKESIYSAFDNYPQTNLKTCDKATTAAYNEYLDKTAERYERKVFIAKKGQILLWHGMLIHGGDGVKDPSLTRKSYVCHYIPKGMNKERQVVGPFNW